MMSVYDSLLVYIMKISVSEHHRHSQKSSADTSAIQPQQEMFV